MADPHGPTRPNYQDTLRALGALVDAWGITTAKLWIGAKGVRVVTPTRFNERHYPWPQLQQVAAERMRLRGRRPAATRAPTARWEVVLRLAGRAMDAAPSECFVVEATLGTVGRAAVCTVEAPEGVVLSAEQAVFQQIEFARRFWRFGRRG